MASESRHDRLGVAVTGYGSVSRGGESSRPQITVVLNWFDELQRLVPTP